MKDELDLVWGWKPDPFGLHQERWISVDGAPTKLVRDGGREAYDPPPEMVVRERLTRSA